MMLVLWNFQLELAKYHVPSVLLTKDNKKSYTPFARISDTCILNLEEFLEIIVKGNPSQINASFVMQFMISKCPLSLMSCEYHVHI